MPTLEFRATDGAITDIEALLLLSCCRHLYISPRPEVTEIANRKLDG